jgi:hypothetical protein
VAELVDATDSKSVSARSAGSIPARGTFLAGATKMAQRLQEKLGNCSLRHHFGPLSLKSPE